MSNIIKKIAARAKQIRKAHPSKTWQACIKQASKELKGKRIGATKKAAPKKQAVKKPANRQTGKSSKLHDERYQAKAPGKRTVKTANGSHVYYERRKNRSDVPGSLSGPVNMYSIRDRFEADIAKVLKDIEFAKKMDSKNPLKKRTITYKKQLLTKLKKGLREQNKLINSVLK